MDCRLERRNPEVEGSHDREVELNVEDLDLKMSHIRKENVPIEWAALANSVRRSRRGMYL